jgi:hypothetical protein
VSVRDELRALLDATPEERLGDVRAYLEQLRAADAAWTGWQQRYGGAATDTRIRTAVAEADAEAGPSLPHAQVAAWLRAWGTDAEPPPPGVR